MPLTVKAAKAAVDDHWERGSSRATMRSQAVRAMVDDFASTARIDREGRKAFASKRAPEFKIR